MLDNESEGTPSPAPTTTGLTTSGTAATAVYSHVPSNFPIPAPMVCKGNLVVNWEFFRKQWEDYVWINKLQTFDPPWWEKIAFKLSWTSISRSRTETMWKHTGPKPTSRHNATLFISGMFSILVQKIKESQLTVTSLAFENSHRLVNFERSPKS